MGQMEPDSSVIITFNTTINYHSLLLDYICFTAICCRPVLCGVEELGLLRTARTPPTRTPPTRIPRKFASTEHSEKGKTTAARIYGKLPLRLTDELLGFTSPEQTNCSRYFAM